MEDNFVNKVIELYEKGDWRTILDEYHDYPERSRLLWVFPSVMNFEFIKKCILQLNCDSVLSVGCGSGLLEWIVTQATCLPVKGIEVDGAWWHCKYAPPQFIPLIMTTPDIDQNTKELLQKSKNTALMFCYFNNREAFDNYLKFYEGYVLVIIGPEYGKGVHTDPKPFEEFGGEWKLYDSQEVRNSKDFIAVYKRVID